MTFSTEMSKLLGPALGKTALSDEKHYWELVDKHRKKALAETNTITDPDEVGRRVTGWMAAGFADFETENGHARTLALRYVLLAKTRGQTKTVSTVDDDVLLFQIMLAERGTRLDRKVPPEETSRAGEDIAFCLKLLELRTGTKRAEAVAKFYVASLAGGEEAT